MEMLEVTSSSIFVRGNKQSFDENGLFSERIFGPLKSFRCKCGKLNSSILDSGKKCPKCNVYCVDNSMRFEQCAYINLPFYSIKPTKISNLSDLKEVIVNIKDFKDTLLNTYVTDINIRSNKYIGINSLDGTLKLFVDKEFKKDIPDYILIPFRITGIFSLIFVLRYVCEAFNLTYIKKLFENDNVILSRLKVLPPGIRPINIDEKRTSNNKIIHLSDVNKSYISLINLNINNSIIIEGLPIDIDDWTQRLDLYFSNMSNLKDELICDNMITEYDIISSRYQYYINEIYDILLKNISGKEGFIRQNMLGKTIEFSARSVIVSDPSLKPYEIKVSRRILYKLWMPYFLYYLINIKNVNSIECYNSLNINNEYIGENKKLFDEFIEWFYAQDSEKDLENG